MPGPVCILMACKNAADTIDASINSVLALPEVGQLIVIDDGSTDGSQDIVQGFTDSRVLLISNEGVGQSAALNTGTRTTQLPYIARCDADDLLVTGRFAKQIAFLENHPDFVAVAGHYRVFLENGFDVSVSPLTDQEEDLTEALLEGRERTHLGTFLIRRDALLEIGGLRDFFISSQDLDLQYRLAQAGRIMFLPGLAYEYLLRGSSISHSASDARRRYYSGKAREFAQQRLAGKTDDLDKGEALPFAPVEGDAVAHMSVDARASGLMEAEAWWQLSQQRYGLAVKKAFWALAYQPKRARKWRALFLITMKSVGGLFSSAQRSSKSEQDNAG